jgi:protein dithiol oxidoreductase (disulfide-forming)
MIRWRTVFAEALVWAALACAGFAAAAQDLEAGKDYGVVTPPQRTDDPSKIVVIEFFSFGCPHCNAFNPSLTLWENTLPKDVRLEREAVIFGRQPWQKLAQIYYALQAIGKAEQLTPSVYGALHVEGVNWQTDQDILDWVAAHGVDHDQFARAFNSFSMRTYVARGDQLATAYKVPSVPTLVVDGKYIRPINDNGDFIGQLAIVDRLIEKARAERKQPSP